MPSTLPRNGLKTPTMPRNWMGATEDFARTDWVLVGLPYDGTTSYRPGTRFGPEAIRPASWGIETYSSHQDQSLDDELYFDAGELELPPGNRDKSLAMIREAAEEVLAADKRWLGIGGEHLVTLPVIESYVRKYPDLGIIHFDAHTDLRDDYMGEKLSHATVLRRAVDLTGPDRLVQFGIRSGTKEEFDWMRENKTLVKTEAEATEALKRLQGRPIFLTIDLDVLDPSILPGTGTPEPGGMSYKEFLDWILFLKNQHLHFVGADVVELSPHYDASGVSTVAAAKVIREVMLLCNNAK